MPEQMLAEGPEVLCERDGAVLIVTLNRPDRLNAIGQPMLDQFAAAMAQSQDPAVRAVIVTGAGRAFCAGADLTPAEPAPAAPALADGPRSSAHLRTVYSMDAWHARWAGAAYACRKPTIALLNGPAAGGGLGMALALDFRIAARSAVLVSAFASIGLAGDNGITYALSRLVGRSKALEILMLSPRLTAEEALELGLVREVVADEDLMETGLAFARRLASGPTSVFATMKANLAFAEVATFEQALDREGVGISISHYIGATAEARRAFLAKQQPVFGG